MPSSLSTFALTSRKIRPKLEVDLTRSGSFTDYTDFWDYFTIYSSTSDKICGVYDTVLDAELNLVNPSLDWVKQGRPVRASIAISDDNWATNHTEQLFLGSTSRQNSVPVNKVKIKATTLNSDYLDKKAARQLFINQDIADIMESLLLEVGVPALNISLSATGIVLPAYPISDNRPIRDYIEDLAKANLSLVGFDKDNIFRAESLAKNSVGGGEFTPDLVVNLNTIESFDSRDMASKFYCNKARLKGYQLRAISNEQLYYNNQLQGYELPPGGKLFFPLEIPSIIPTEIRPLTRRSRPIGGGGYPIGTGLTNLSYYDFYTNDDGAGAAYTGTDIQLVSQSIATDNGKEVFLGVWRNTSVTTTYYLKSLLLKGSGAQIISELIEEAENSTIEDDGGEILFELESYALQDDAKINNLISIIQLNFWNYADVYKFTLRGRPELQIGSIIEFRDYQDNTVTGVVFEIDTEVSKDRAYEQTVIVKTLLPNPEGGYLAFDVAGTGFDISAFF